MKIELTLPPKLVDLIADKVIKALKPILPESKKNLIYRHNSGTEGK